MLPRSRLLASFLLGSSLLFAACKERPAPVTPPRALLRADAATYSVVPTAGQLPYCVVIEVQAMAARSLVAGEDGESAECEANKALGPWKLPPGNEPFRAYVIFSDRKLNGDTVAMQIRGLLAEDPKRAITPMDLRAPGQVTVDVLEGDPRELRGAK